MRVRLRNVRVGAGERSESHMDVKTMETQKSSLSGWGGSSGEANGSV